MRVLFVGNAFEAGESVRGPDALWAMAESTLARHPGVELRKMAIEPWMGLRPMFPIRLRQAVQRHGAQIVIVRQSAAVAELLDPAQWRAVCAPARVVLLATSEPGPWAPAVDAIAHVLGWHGPAPVGGICPEYVGFPPVDPRPFAGWAPVRTWDVVFPSIAEAHSPFVEAVRRSGRRVVVGVDAVPEVLRQARVVVNFGIGVDGRGRVLPRALSALHAGAVLVERANPASRALWGEQAGVAWFETPEELAEVVDGLLADGAACRARSSAGRAFLEAHRPEQFWSAVLDMVPVPTSTPVVEAAATVSDAVPSGVHAALRTSVRIPVREVGHIALLCADPGSAKDLERLIESLRSTVHDVTQLTLVVPQRVDLPDDPESALWRRQLRRSPVKVVEVAVAGSFVVGEDLRELRAACAAIGPDIYLVVPPGGRFVQRGWDDSLRRVGALYDDGVFVATLRDPAGTPWPAVGAAWANTVGGVFTELFPAPFDVRWVLDVAGSLTRRVELPVEVASAASLPLYNPAFWSAAYDATVRDRSVDARALIAATWPELGAAVFVLPADPMVPAPVSGPRPPGDACLRAETRVIGRLREVAAASEEAFEEFDVVCRRSSEAARLLHHTLDRAVRAHAWDEVFPTLGVLLRDFGGHPEPYRLAAEAMERSGDAKAAARVRRMGRRLFPDDPEFAARTA